MSTELQVFVLERVTMNAPLVRVWITRNQAHVNVIVA